ncbi:MAG: XRE family transcriptional regulator [Magnetococcus sp. DMHC-8]
MTLAERIHVARKQAGLTQKELADQVGVSQTAIHKLEGGSSRSSRRTVAIALACGVDPIWLDTGRGNSSLFGTRLETHPTESTPVTQSGEFHRPAVFARLPLISWEELGRSCTESGASFHPQAVEAWIPVAPRSSERSFALRVRDDSMKPEFLEGEMIIVDPTLPGRHNQFVIARVADDGMATFKQLIMIGSHTYLKPLNDRYPLVDVQGSIHICGVIVGKYRAY